LESFWTCLVRCRARRGVPVASSSARRVFDLRSSSRSRFSSGDSGSPKISANERGAVCEEFSVPLDLAGLFVDFREPPELELLWRFRDGIVVPRVVDGGCQRREYLSVAVCCEWLHEVINQPVSDGV